MDLIGPENLVAPLLDMPFNSKDPVSIKACLVLEFTVKERVASLHPYIDHFTRKIRYVRNESAIRPLSKICEYLLIDYFIHTHGTTQAVLTTENLERIAAFALTGLSGTTRWPPKYTPWAVCFNWAGNSIGSTRNYGTSWNKIIIVKVLPVKQGHG
jgi:hypothetical protein